MKPLYLLSLFTLTACVTQPPGRTSLDHAPRVPINQGIVNPTLAAPVSAQTGTTSAVFPADAKATSRK